MLVLVTFKGKLIGPSYFILQALNQLFEKIMALDIDERHLLRLGHGEEELETEKDFSRWASGMSFEMVDKGIFNLLFLFLTKESQEKSIMNNQTSYWKILG